MTLSTETLQRFCASEDDLRPYLQAPWRAGGFIFATNGHLLLEVPDDGREGIVERDKHPDAPAMFVKYPAHEYIPIPELPPKAKCETCNGAGKARIAACDECDDGYFDHGSHEYQCKQCDGAGHVTKTFGELVRCIDCDGFGEQIRCSTDRTWVGEKVGAATRYLRAISELPDVLISPSEPDKAIAFKFTGGRGLLMPMRTEP